MTLLKLFQFLHSLYSTLLAVFVGLVSLPYFLLLANGILAAWIYLRFYQRHSRGRGDLGRDINLRIVFGDFPKLYKRPKPLKCGLKSRKKLTTLPLPHSFLVFSAARSAFSPIWSTKFSSSSKFAQR